MGIRREIDIRKVMNMGNLEEITPEEIQKVLDGADYFSGEVKVILNKILSQAVARGYPTAAEKSKLLEIVDMDLAVDQIELEANGKIATILQDIGEKLGKVYPRKEAIRKLQAEAQHKLKEVKDRINEQTAAIIRQLEVKGDVEMASFAQRRVKKILEGLRIPVLD